MSNLYQSLAEIYNKMYQTFINYDDEFIFYNQILRSAGCNEVIEIGCGTGNLAGRLIANGFRYTGIDLSEEMLSIARRSHPKGEFIHDDMRTFDLARKFESVIITGRTISYLVANKDLYDALCSIKKNLKEGGLICFDCIDASRFIPLIREGEKITHKASFDDKNYVRESFWNINFSQSWTFDWQSVYYEDRGGELQKIGEDNSTIRAFTKDEITLFLKLTGFEIKEMIDRPSYAFDTFVVVAESNV